jgi:hypothetical protein
METQRIETKEELRKKLRNKIKNKSGSRTNGISRKKGQSLNDSLSKVSDILQNKNINSPDQIDATTIQNIMSILNKDDLETILNKVKEDSMFKDILKTVGDKYSDILGKEGEVVNQEKVVEQSDEKETFQIV